MIILLIIITGASGTGKSSIVPFLRKRLPSTFLVYDFDALGEPFDGTDTWKDRHLANMFAIVKKNRLNDVHTVVCGLIRPQWVDPDTINISDFTVNYILLTMTKEQRKNRLELRNAPLELIEDQEELNQFPMWMKSNAQFYHTIDTTYLSLVQITAQIVDWIMQYN